MTDNLSEITESRVSQSDAQNLDNSPGAQLRRAREKTGLSCEELSRRLCMTVDKLELLERDEYERLPGAIYVRGYIRNACKELAIDPEPVLQAYSGYAAAEEESREILAHVSRGPVVEKRKRSYKGLALLPLLAVAGVFWWINDRGLTAPALASFQSGSVVTQAAEEPPVAESKEFASAANPAAAANGVEPSSSEPLAAESLVAEPVPTEGSTADMPDMDSEAAAPVAQAETVADAPEVAREPAVPVPESGVEAVDTASETAAVESPSEPVPAADTSPTAATSTDSLQLQFDEDAWIEVKDATGAVLLAKLKPAGSHVTLAGQPPFSVMLGNAAGTQVRYRGELVDSAPLGSRRTRRLTVGE